MPTGLAMHKTPHAAAPTQGDLLPQPRSRPFAHSQPTAAIVFKPQQPPSIPHVRASKFEALALGRLRSKIRRPQMPTPALSVSSYLRMMCDALCVQRVGAHVTCLASTRLLKHW
jgi:hypothetical protein